MNVWRIGLLGIALVVGAGCNSPTCGTGTKQVQQPNGELKCLPVDAPASGITCDEDAGVHLFAGACVSTVTCDESSTMYDPDTHTCVGTGGGVMMMPHVPAPCPTPAATSFCISGVVRHLEDNRFLAQGERVRVAVYAPLAFLADPGVKPIAEVETGDTYTIKNITIASLGVLPLVALGVGDPVGTTTPTLQVTGAGAQVKGGESYTVDTYITPKSLVATWSAASGGIDYDAMGAFVLRYYSDPAPPPTNFAATETMPVSGVMVIRGLTTPPTARYFGSSLQMIDPALTATSALGAAIVPSSGQVENYSGMGGGVAQWEAAPGGTAPHVVFVARFHPAP